MIKRTDFDWGCLLEVRPFADTPALAMLKISAEVMIPKPSRGSEVRVTFSGVSIGNHLSLTQSQTWATAFSALTLTAHEASVKLKAKTKRPKGR